jgi:large subunit ribosomal protein L23
MISNPNFYDLMLAPVVTEKSTSATQFNQYVFKVHKSANKEILIKFIEAEFKVKVISINILNVKDKMKRFKGTIGRRSGYKKAIVKLADGQSISII